MKGFYVIAIVAVVALALSPFLLLDAPDENQYEGKIVRYGFYGTAVRSVDPATCGDVMSSTMVANVFEGLYTYHFLKHNLVIPQLAADDQVTPDVSPDGLTYRIRLRRDVKYHRNPCFGKDPSGEHKWATRTVEAKDFVLTFKRIADYHVTAGLGWAFTERIKGIKAFRKRTREYKVGDFSRYDLEVEGLKAIDDLTLQITLSEPFPQFSYVLAMHTYAPIPREAVDYWLGTKDDGAGGRESIPEDDRQTEFREARQLVGTGAYTWKTFERKTRIVLERNGDFRHQEYPSDGDPGDAEAGLLVDAGKQVPFIDVLHFDFVSATSSGWMLFLTRQNDATSIPKDAFDAVINPNKDLEDRWAKRRISMKKYWQPVVYWIVFNMEDKVVGQSKALRQALCACFDVESYLKVLFNDRGRRAVNIVPNTFDGWKQAGPGPYFKLDMDLARAKLEQAKKELGAKGLLKNGEIPPLTIDLSATDPEMAKRGEFFQQQFAKLGVKLKVNQNDWPKLQEKVHNKQAQMYTMGWHADYPDAENFLQLYYSPNITKGTNNSNYANPEFDALYEKVRVMPDTPGRTALYVKMMRMINEDCPVLLLTEPQSYVLVYDWITNYKPHPLGYGYSKYRRLNVDLRRELGGKER